MNCKKIMKKYLIIFALVLVISQARNEKILASSVIQIIGQPQSVSGEVYTPISMSVTASGENLSYQWEYYDVNSGSWKDYIGQTESVLNAPIYSDWNGLRLRCRVTDGANQVACSNEATVTIVKPLEITSQPKSVSGQVGTPISMSVTASGENLSYQWEYYDVNSGSWKDYIGQTESVLNAPIYSDWNGLRLRCRVTDGANQVACSNEATVTIVKPLEITSQPKSVSGQVGTPISMSVTASGENLSYQWEYYDVNSGSWKDYIGQTESVLNAPIYSDWNGLRLRCRVTDGANQVACSNEATVTIVKPLEITSQPKSVSGQVGTPISMSVTASGENLSYQWEYYDVNSGSWKDYIGQTESVLNAPIYSDWNGLRLRCRVTDGANQVACSNEATVTIVKPLEITSQPKSVSGQVGTPISMSVTASGENLSYQWEYYDVNSGSWKDYIGQTESVLNAPIYSDWNGLRLRCRVADVTSMVVYSDYATVYIINNEDWELPII